MSKPTHSNRAKPLQHTKDQHARVNHAYRRRTLASQDDIERLGASFRELAYGTRMLPSLVGYAQTLREGGTLPRDHLNEVASKVPDVDRSLRGILECLGDMTGGTLGREISLKVYTPKKMRGRGPHRDHNLEVQSAGPSIRPSVVSMVGVLGLKESAIWAVPHRLVLPGTDVQVMRSASRKECLTSFQGYLGPEKVEITPFNVATQAPGDVTFIDERPPLGIWEDPVHGEMAVWHSVHANFSPEPIDPADNMVVTLVTRGGRSQPGLHLPPSV